MNSDRDEQYSPSLATSLSVRVGVVQPWDELRSVHSPGAPLVAVGVGWLRKVSAMGGRDNRSHECSPLAVPSSLDLSASIAGTTMRV